MIINFKLYQHGVIAVCEQLHGDACGSGDPIPDDMKAELIAWLKWRVKDWVPGVKHFAEYDYAVLSLARATIAMVDND